MTVGIRLQTKTLPGMTRNLHDMMITKTITASEGVVEAERRMVLHARRTEVAVLVTGRTKSKQNHYHFILLS
jgi:hypothetical protein